MVAAHRAEDADHAVHLRPPGRRRARRPPPLRLGAALAVVALAAWPALADEATPARDIDLFDDEGAFGRAKALGGKLKLARGDDGARAPGDVGPRGGWLVATVAPEEAAQAAVESRALTIVVPLPAGLDLSRHASLELSVRAPSAEGHPPPVVRLLALDADGRTLFSRRLRDAARGAWSGIAQPLFLFRWGDRVGRWSEVRSLGVATYGGPSLEVDHLRAGAGPRGARSAAPPDGWLAALAFRAAAREAAPEGEDEERDAGPAPRPVRIEAGPVRLLLDPAVKEDAAAAARIGERARHIAAWLDRVAAAAVEPLDDAPVEVILAADPDGVNRFLRRLGREWRVDIGSPPRGAGYTIQDIAVIPDDPKLGIDRPVVFHEAVHAVAARRLRIPPGQGPADGLQEGLATYLQFALFPASFDRRQWPAVVERWRPLAEAAKDPGFNDYPGLAGVVAFLVSERPEWLGSLAGSLAHGATFEAAVKAAPGGATIAALDRDWRHWARRTLCDKKAPPDAPHWPIPAEWSSPARR